MDEPVNVDLEPEEALRLLLGEQRKNADEEQCDDSEDEDT